ncbi:unnamed protein product [marine sediment metagenome]|uniref:Uncharacterized protein n=1 Tax=marine sediment metagenome TaxID=412755 RepID=X0X7Q7_9ZZZZ
MAHRKVVVARSEHTLEPIDLAYGDRVFTLPGAMPLPALEAMEDGNKIIAFLKACFGPKQWKEFSDVFDTQDLEGLADAVADVYGNTPGESEASGDS